MFERLKKVVAILNSGEPQNGGPKVIGPVDALKASYHQLITLAEQIDLHAEKAPYPHLAQQLRQIAAAKRSGADLLREKMLSLWARPEEKPLDLKSARNHWERMVQDLDDQKELETRFEERATVLAEEAPEIAELLRELVTSQSHHRVALLDLIARADPQADQT